jgi:hypothetical protein
MKQPNLSRRLYGALTRLYPKSLRDGFADAQIETFDDWISEARARRGLLGVAGVWREAAADWAWSMLLAYRQATSPHEAVRAAATLVLLISLTLWSLIGVSMVGQVSWATDFVESPALPNSYVALGGPCVAVILSALVNPWRSRRLSPLLVCSAVISVSAWLLALSTWDV